MSNKIDRLVKATEFIQRIGIKKTKFYDATKAGIIPPLASKLALAYGRCGYGV